MQIDGEEGSETKRSLIEIENVIATSRKKTLSLMCYDKTNNGNGKRINFLFSIYVSKALYNNNRLIIRIGRAIIDHIVLSALLRFLSPKEMKKTNNNNSNETSKLLTIHKHVIGCSFPENCLFSIFHSLASGIHHNIRNDNSLQIDFERKTYAIFT